MSDANRAELIVRPEGAFGAAPPANAATTRVRFRSESLTPTIVTDPSDEIRSDRQLSDLPLTGKDVAGDIEHDVHYGAGSDFERWLEAALCGTWGTPGANQLRNGNVKRSFNVEKRLLDVGAYVQNRGLMVNRFGFEIVARRRLGCTVGLMGTEAIAAAVSIAGTTPPTDAVASRPMKAGPLIALLDAGTAATQLNGHSARRIALDIVNNLRGRELATSYFTDGFGLGQQEITGVLETYFNSIATLQAFLANGDFSLRFRMRDPILAGGAGVLTGYEVTLPLLKVTSAPVNIGGINTEVAQPIGFRAMVDEAVGYSMHVERVVIA